MKLLEEHVSVDWTSAPGLGFWTTSGKKKPCSCQQNPISLPGACRHHSSVRLGASHSPPSYPGALGDAGIKAGQTQTMAGWWLFCACVPNPSQAIAENTGLSSVHAGWPRTPLSNLRPGECSISRRRLSPAASGWAGSHPGITSDLCRGYRGWLWLASALQTAHGRVNNALHPPSMQPPASLGGPRAAPETFLLEVEKKP